LNSHEHSKTRKSIAMEMQIKKARETKSIALKGDRNVNLATLFHNRKAREKNKWTFQSRRWQAREVARALSRSGDEQTKTELLVLSVLQIKHLRNGDYLTQILIVAAPNTIKYF